MRRSVLFAAVAGCLVLTLGCYPPASRLNAPPQGDSPRPSELQEPFTYMVDNAMLADMSLTDIHFVPHTAELNALGAHRLDRYARLLDMYGGTLRYDTTLTDEDLVAARIKHVKDFLATTEIEPGRIEVTKDLAGGRGMTAERAIIVLDNWRYPSDAWSASPELWSGGGGGGGAGGGGQGTGGQSGTSP